MGLFGAIGSFLSGTVGDGLENDPADVRNAKRGLSALGFFDGETENDFITRELDSSIRGFQRDNDLRVDGILLPGGETETSIMRDMDQEEEVFVGGFEQAAENAHEEHDPIFNPDPNRPYSGPGGDIGPVSDKLYHDDNEEIYVDEIGVTSEHLDPRDDEESSSQSDTENEGDDEQHGDTQNRDTDEPSREKEPLPTVNKEEVVRRVIEQQIIDQENMQTQGKIDRDPDSRAVGSFGVLPENVDATGRVIRDDGQAPAPGRKPVVNTQKRKDAILNNKEADFNIASNPNADGRKPLHALDSYSEVKGNEKTIEKEASKVGVDPDLVKAIVHLETTQGWYDRIAFGQESSIRPMNVQSEYWKDLGFSREDLKDPEKNIQAGVKLLERIEKNMPDADIAKKATIYHNLGARKVSDYGARVEQLHREKPWRNDKLGK